LNWNWFDWLFGPHPPIFGESGSDGSGGSTVAGGSNPPPVTGGGSGGGCAPAFTPLGDNSAWFVYHGIEVGLVVLMLIGILAILFGNSETDVSIAEVAAA